MPRQEKKQVVKSENNFLNPDKNEGTLKQGMSNGSCEKWSDSGDSKKGGLTKFVSGLKTKEN